MRARFLIAALVTAVAVEARAAPRAPDVAAPSDAQMAKVLAIESFAPPAPLVSSIVTIDVERLAELAIASPASVANIADPRAAPTYDNLSPLAAIERFAKPPNSRNTISDVPYARRH